MDSKEKIIRKYFKSWIDNDISVIERYFGNNIIYEESWGLAYVGIAQVKKWFIDWHKHSKVLKWDIKEVVNLDTKVICQWYFKLSSNDYIEEFNGVSIGNFNNENKIIQLKEYMAKLPLVYPYSFNKE
ncbi:MAG: nuclear transport factor 2 family protein [Clostridium sp.]|uniref:nuclear transport factor 2 family protein n=1 Tax=Clostridium sp. TaxID=1506 RepID=UPI003F390AEA